jgi:UDP-N-acetylmuramate--alanine ligase
MTQTFIVLPIYAAGEAPLPGITAERLVEQIKNSGTGMSYAQDFLGRKNFGIRSGRRPPASLGAGDIWKVGEKFWKAEDRRGDRPQKQKS